MKPQEMIRTILIMMTAGIILGGCAELHSYLLPDRDVQKLPADYQVTASELTAEFLNDTDRANLKYLSDDGESKILEITGRVSRITENFNGDKVLFLQNDNDKAGVTCTFMPETNHSVDDIKPGDVATVKGDIIHGAYYDEGLGMFVNATVNNCDIIN
jgi:hypothetical protein